MTFIYGAVTNQVSGGTFHGSVQQIVNNNFYREVLAALALDESTITWFRDIHVETPASGAARTVLRDRSAVALTGPPGCGRQTTGIVLLAELGVIPKTVVLDPEDLDRPLEILPGHGYLLDLDEDHDQLTASVGRWLQDLATRLRAMGTYLVVRARDQSWKSLELDEFILKAIPVTAPTARAVFESHLKKLTSDFIADAWARHEPVTRLLANAGPPEGVRLAQIACQVEPAAIPDDQHVAEAVEAYSNWADTLTEWFSRTTGPENGHSRALLLATAALDGAPAATIFTAADQLSELVDLPRIPGGALVGPDVGTLVDKTSAELHGRAILFPKPAYATSVLDYVWRERPHMQGVLRDWLISIPDAGDRDTGRAASSLTQLAIRQGEANMVCSAAAQWIRKSASLRELGVRTLTDAAMSEQVGREVRRRLYEWAKAGSTSEEVHLAVAEVCGGRLARAYPQIALTRLRHLAMRTTPAIRSAAQETMVSLAQVPTLRHTVMNEIANWVQGPEPRQSAGHRVFLQLASPGETGAIAIIAVAANKDLDLLGELWRAILRGPESAEAARTASMWLEAAAQNHAPRDTILEILARTCQTSIDRATLTEIATDWVRATGSAAVPRNELLAELLDRAWQRDPITVASSRPVWQGP